MSYTNILHFNSAPGDRTLNRPVAVTANGEINVSESIPDSSTDLLVAFTLDVSAAVSFFMVSDQDITIETNDGSTPDDTINLLAGVPYVWHENAYDSFLFGTDITALYVTNASGSAAALEISAGYDPTP